MENNEVKIIADAMLEKKGQKVVSLDLKKIGTAISDYFNPQTMITVVLKNKEDIAKLPIIVPSESNITVLEKPTKEYMLMDDKTTYYVCHNNSCQPPVNVLQI